MKPTFKKTALSILVAFGVSACGSSGGSDTPSTTTTTPTKNVAPTVTPSTTPSTTTQTPSTSAQAPSTSAQTPSTSAQTPSTPSTPQTTTKDETPAVSEQARIAKEIAQLERTKQTSEGNEWRRVGIQSPQSTDLMTSFFGSPSNVAFTGDGLATLPAPYTKDADHIAKLGEYSPFKKTSSQVVVDLNEITKQDIQNGGKFLGEHSGTYQSEAIEGLVASDIKDVKYDAYVRGNPNQIELTNTKNADSVNYLFINQPYSSYGALFTNNHDSRLFAFGVPTTLYENKVVDGVTTSKLIYKEGVEGEATYKGQVIASTLRYYSEDDNDPRTYTTTPAVDGTVTLTTYFDQTPEKNYIKGEIDSQTVGKIELQQGNSNHLDGAFGGEAVANNDKFVSTAVSGGTGGHSTYDGRLVGENGQEAVGTVKLLNETSQNYNGGFSLEAINHTHQKDEIQQYNAVFAAERQAK